jgi:hypothetical protein
VEAQQQPGNQRLIGVLGLVKATVHGAHAVASAPAKSQTIRKPMPR